MLDFLTPSSVALVVGASGGIGAAVAEALLAHSAVGTLIVTGHRHAPQTGGRRVAARVDVTDETSIAALAELVRATGELRLVVVASGLLSNVAGIAPEKSWRALDATTLATLFAVNSIGPALLAKHLLPLLPRHGRAIFAALSARVGSIEDNRRGGWYGYRASKAALNMLLKSLALELTRRAPAALCVGLHPGTVDTALSKPFQSAVPEQQLFTPAQSALCLLEVLDGLQDSDTGGVFAWDGSRVPA